MAVFTSLSKTDILLNPSLITDNLLTSAPGIVLDASTLSVIAGANSIGLYDGSLALGQGAGLLLTTGIMPGTFNSAGFFGADIGMAGDPDLDAVVNKVFRTTSYDATSISVSFTVTDPTIKGVSFNIVFGSDEFPEWVNAFVDIGAIFVNGVNVAYFNHDTAAPLSVIGSNLANNYFINNTGNLTTASYGGIAVAGVASTLPIEYDGVSAPMTVFAPVHQGLNTLKIAIADTGDHIYDSGLFISNMRGTDVPVSGITLPMQGTEADDDLHGTNASDSSQALGGNDSIDGAGGDDILMAGAGDDSITGGAGNDYIDGGDGADIAHYSGLASDYAIVKHADLGVTIADLRTAGTDGADRLLNVEQAVFADMSVDLTLLVPTAITAEALDPVTIAAIEDGAPVTASAIPSLPPSIDPAMATIAAMPATLPAGVTFNAATNSFTIDPSNAAYQNLAAGEQITLSVNYAVVDNSFTEGDISFPASVQFIISGKNDAPVAGSQPTIAVTAGDAAVSVNALAGASDVDNGAVLSVVLLDPATTTTTAAPADGNGSHGGADSGTTTTPAPTASSIAALPPGISFDAATNSFVLDPNDPAFIPLYAGQVLDLVVNYGISDGTVITPASMTFTVTGIANPPVVSGPAETSATEDAGNAMLGRSALLANVSATDGTVALDITVDDATLPAGVVYHHTPGSTTVSTTTYYGFTQIITIPTVDTLTLDTSNAAYQSLAAGESLDVVVGYTVGNANASAPAQAIFHLTGSNDAPVIAGDVTGAATEGSGAITVSALANATDIDHGAVFSVVAAPPPAGEVESVVNALGVVEKAAPPLPPIVAFDPTTLPAGVSFDAATNSFILDPNDPSFAALAGGQTLNVVVNYGVSDGTVATAARVVFTITGVDNVPTVNGPASSIVTEDTGSVFIDRSALLANVHQTGAPTELGIQIDEASLPAGVTYHHVTGSISVVVTTYYGFQQTVTITAPTEDILTLDTANAAYQSLADGESQDILIGYTVSAGTASAHAQALFHLNGANDAPIVAGIATADAIEGGAAATLDALAQASDIDHGAVLSVVAKPLPAAEVENFLNAAGVLEGAAPPPPPILPFDPATLPAGVSFDAATNSFTLDPTDLVYRSLAVGQTKIVTIQYGISDGIVATAASASFTITGTNDAPVVSGPLTGLFVNEDGAAASYNLPALLSVAHDVDQGDQLTVSVDGSTLPAGVSYLSTPEQFVPGQFVPVQIIQAGPRATPWGHYVYPTTIVPAHVTPDQIVPATTTLSIDASDAAYQSLAQGEELEVVVDYTVSDGIASTAAQAIFTVNGMNDAPLVAAPILAAATEDGALVSVNGLANATDVDHGAVLSLVAAPPPAPHLPETFNGDILDAAEAAAVAAILSPPAIQAFDPATLPAGVSFDPATNSFTIDPSNAAFQYLAQGQTANVTVTYGVSDGMAV